MKKIILFYLLFFQNVIYAQKRYDFNSVQGIIEYRIEKPYEVVPEEELEKAIQLLSQFEQSNSYKLTSTTNKLIVLATLAEVFFEFGNITEGDNYIKQFINLYEASYTKSIDKQKNNSIDYSYRLFLLNHAENLSRTSTNLDEILLFLNKAKKVKINFEELNFSFDNELYFYESMVYGNAGYYDKAITSINKAIEICKKLPFDKKKYISLHYYYYYLLNNYIMTKINNEGLTQKEKLNLLTQIDKNILQIENINSNRTNWTYIYSQKAYADYLRNNIDSANIYLEKALTRPSKENYFYDYDYLLPKIYKLIILIKTKKYHLVKGLKSEIENDDYFNELISNTDFNSTLILLYTELIVYEKDQNNHQKALLYTEKRQQILDDKRNEDFHFKMREYQENQNILQKNIEIEKLDNKKKQLIIFLIIVVNLLLLVIIFAYFYVRKKSKESRILFSKIKNITDNEIFKINLANQEALKELKKRFSMQLHTDVGSLLVATVNFLKIKRKLDPKIEDQQLWDAIIQELEKIYKTVRQESHDIYENSFSNQQFLAELEKNIKLIFSASKSFRLHTCIEINDKTELNVDTKLFILNTIKEGCTNIIKYAKAKNIDINLVEDETAVILEIKDDGKPNIIKKSSSLGIGLKTLNEKIKSLNGKLHFGKRKNCDGFEIIAIFPKQKKLSNV